MGTVLRVPVMAGGVGRWSDSIQLAKLEIPEEAISYKRPLILLAAPLTASHLSRVFTVGRSSRSSSSAGL